MNAVAVKLCPVVRRMFQSGAAIILCTVMSACIGATPLPKRTRTASGTEVKTIDTSFIHLGQTTRTEVKDKLKVIDTGYENDRYFLGRWSSSTWGGWIVAAGMCCEAIGGGGRVWKTGNLLIEFDSAGVVIRVEPFSDHKILQVLAPVAQNTALQLDPPLVMPVKYWNQRGAFVEARMILSATNLDVEELDESTQSDAKKGDPKKAKPKKLARISVPVKDLSKLEMPYAQGDDAEHVGPRIHFSKDLREFGGPRGKYLNLAVGLPETVMLMSYLTRIQNGKGQ